MGILDAFCPSSMRTFRALDLACLHHSELDRENTASRRYFSQPGFRYPHADWTTLLRYPWTFSLTIKLNFAYPFLL